MVDGIKEQWNFPDRHREHLPVDSWAASISSALAHHASRRRRARNMNRPLAVALLLMPALASAEATIQDCLHAARGIRPGKFVKVEYLGVTDERQAAYEIELKPVNGRRWEFECSAGTGAILEMEQEVDSTDDPLFKRTMKVDEKSAIATATNLYPGTVTEVEYELDANGSPRYEIDIVDIDSIEMKIEVSATTGAIEEVQIELWEIGEPRARR
jgi:uncharacterized membrane protein YkoI